MIVTSGDNKDREKPKAGIHRAICFRIFDLGRQMDKLGQVRPKIWVWWELDEKTSDGRPFTASKQYTASFFKRSNLRKDVESWLNKKFEDNAEFDVDALIGKTCTLILVESGEWINVSAVAPDASIVPMKAVNPSDWHPDFVKKIQAKSVDSDETKELDKLANGLL